MFNSSNDCSRYYKTVKNIVLDRHEISKVLSGKRLSYKGFDFRYADENDLKKYKNLMVNIDKSINVH